jgi:hypothetical protein
VSLAGRVYESDGRPLAGARVFLFPLEAAVSGPLPGAVSGEDGSYRLTSPAFGKTRISASLERLGYPDTFYKIFSSPADHFPEVILAPGVRLESVDIHLGLPDGLVEGTVLDRTTGTAVPFARITLRWSDEPSVSMSEDVPRTGHFQYALPMRPIAVEITAPGYRPWVYVNPSTGARFVELAPHDRLSVQIELDRAVPASGLGPSSGGSPPQISLRLPPDKRGAPKR